MLETLDLRCSVVNIIVIKMLRHEMVYVLLVLCIARAGPPLLPVARV